MKITPPELGALVWLGSTAILATAFITHVDTYSPQEREANETLLCTAATAVVISGGLLAKAAYRISQFFHPPTTRAVAAPAAPQIPQHPAQITPTEEAVEDAIREARRGAPAAAA
ncbi:MAG: hypothetical protein P1U63_08895 [Coxiellaceae bacterium]|nr:hypothetical protein [Coxiellaceae bacterium]